MLTRPAGLGLRVLLTRRRRRPGQTVRRRWRPGEERQQQPSNDRQLHGQCTGAARSFGTERWVRPVQYPLNTGAGVWLGPPGPPTRHTTGASPVPAAAAHARNRQGAPPRCPLCTVPATWPPQLFCSVRYYRLVRLRPAGGGTVWSARRVSAARDASGFACLPVPPARVLPLSISRSPARRSDRTFWVSGRAPVIRALRSEAARCSLEQGTASYSYAGVPEDEDEVTGHGPTFRQV